MKKLGIKNRFDILIGFGVIGIVLMIIIPLPPFILDALLVLNISLSVLILLMTIFSTNVLQLSIFPTILLITTLFRLGLNISSTRLILSEGYAGNVIEAFGSFVVRGNYVVGIMIFLIIIIIQFVVITNGSGRVSEVSARFTLDAMPGKQMSIDADLNAGMIDENTAKKRRKDLQEEADFYGSMDGASKFVKGDAIAGIIVTLINIIGGIIIGVVMMKMTFSEAAQNFIRLTIGDGLVSQIPALLISTSAGILVTKAASDDSFANLAGKQLTSIPKAIMMTGAVLFVLGIIPGLPKMAFFTLGVGAMLIGKTLINEEKKMENKDENTVTSTPETNSINEVEDVSELLNVEPLEVEIGYGLIPLADESDGGDLLQRIASIRRQCAINMGIIVQPIRIRDNLQLNPNQYCIKIRGNKVSTYDLMPTMLLCMDPMGLGLEMEGIKAIEPSFGLEAVWINKDNAEEAELRGYTIVDPSTILVTHLLEIIKEKSHELMGREEVKQIIDATKEKYSVIVDELIPDLMTLGEVQKVFQNLLREKVSIKDRVTILETLADNAVNTKDIELLTEYVRMALSKSICSELVDETNYITVSTLSNEVERIISNNLQKSTNGTYPAVDPESTNKIFRSIKEITERVDFYNNRPIILVSPKIRAPFRKLVEMVFPSITILSLNEIPNDVQIRAQAVVNI
ncbi:flagellar biosynthesis protein FlhA [Clostridium cadaveris]|uniref:Flagellar biosynthesis protein FlhA n=3 Tax=Clostridium TaxID=1485 RepID=A0A1I2LVC7_9CLOT|nr:flagellar biosynthesis protein FlhA [Clostridium cadaveris]MDM8312346.1 flagellar biosynthesis protein FlhA [Clostridium cadaveris]MDY4948506.1 flagellar biosynthesis protein FlhA [Clostridium cadaveris]NME63758.1 flagellar biosynthesis protein FlhA [Clostridium cadaveris]SFF83234.1 flagellar biosynthesis protein FlhA [Clostridium cadaveris]